MAVNVEQILTKHMNNLSASADVIEGKDPIVDVVDEKLVELQTTNMTYTELVMSKAQALATQTAADLVNAGTVDPAAFLGLATFTRLPGILSANVAENRFFKAGNKYLLVTMVNGANNGVTVYELDTVNGALSVILYIDRLDDTRDERSINGVDQFDIIWDHIVGKYRVFWVQNTENKVMTGLITNMELTNVEIISANTSEKNYSLRAGINTGGDIVVFCSAIGGATYSIGMLISKEKTLTGWQTRDLLAAQGLFHDYSCQGRVQVINNEFFYSYSNQTDRVYLVRVVNIANELVSSTVTAAGNYDLCNLTSYSKIDIQTGLPVYYLVITSTTAAPLVIKVQNDLVFTIADKLKFVPIDEPHYFLSTGEVVMKNMTSRNNGEQWVEGFIGQKNGVASGETNNLAVLKMNDKDFYLVNLASLLDYTKPITIR